LREHQLIILTTHIITLKQLPSSEDILKPLQLKFTTMLNKAFVWSWHPFVTVGAISRVNHMKVNKVPRSLGDTRR
jgi:hypothetical protein